MNCKHSVNIGSVIKRPMLLVHSLSFSFSVTSLTYKQLPLVQTHQRNVIKPFFKMSHACILSPKVIKPFYFLQVTLQNPGSFQSMPFLLHPELMEIKAEG